MCQCPTCGQEIVAPAISDCYIKCQLDWETQAWWHSAKESEHLLAIFDNQSVDMSEDGDAYDPWESSGGVPILLDRVAARKLRDFLSKMLGW